MKNFPKFLVANLAAALAFWLAAPPLRAQAPEPAPTDAASEGPQQVEVIGIGTLPPGTETAAAREAAREAALLSAYRQLAEDGAERLGVLRGDPSARDGYQYFRISSDHPNDVLMGWTLRSEVIGEELAGSQLKVRLKSPPISELHSDFPHLLRSLNHDLDGDKVPELIGVAFDGRLYALKKTPRGYEQLACSPSLATLSSRTYCVPGSKQAVWDHVRLSRPETIQSVEQAGGSRGTLRLSVTVATTEAVSGCYLGGAAEEHEVLLRLQSGPDPSLELETPRDFSHTNSSSALLKGLVRTPQGLSAARLQFNGREYWSTPLGLNTRKLKMDLVVPLLPGFNRASVHVVDQNKQTTVREVILHRQAPVAALDPNRRRALLVGIQNYASPQFPEASGAESDLKELRSVLSDRGGFSAQNTRTLLGAQATRKEILDQIRAFGEEQNTDSKAGRGLLIIYFNGLTTPGTAAGGKSLLPYDARGLDEGAITADELVQALGPLGNLEVLLVVDGVISKLRGASADGRWLDNHDFLETLTRAGWAVVTSGDPDPGAAARRVGNLSKAMVSALKGEADTDNDGAIELDELYRCVFTQVQSELAREKSHPIYPLRRGQILGRIPLVKVRAPAARNQRDA